MMINSVGNPTATGSILQTKRSTLNDLKTSRMTRIKDDRDT